MNVDSEEISLKRNLCDLSADYGSIDNLIY